MLSSAGASYSVPLIVMLIEPPPNVSGGGPPPPSKSTSGASVHAAEPGAVGPMNVNPPVKADGPPPGTVKIGLMPPPGGRRTGGVSSPGSGDSVPHAAANRASVSVMVGTRMIHLLRCSGDGTRARERSRKVISGSGECHSEDQRAVISGGEVDEQQRDLRLDRRRPRGRDVDGVVRRHARRRVGTAAEISADRA